MAPKGGEGEALAEASSGVSEGRLVRVAEGVPLPVAMPDMLAPPEAVAEADPLTAGDLLELRLGESLRWDESVARELAVDESDGRVAVAGPVGEGSSERALLPLPEAEPETVYVRGADTLAPLLTVLDGEAADDAVTMEDAEPTEDGAEEAEGGAVALEGCVAWADCVLLGQPLTLLVRAAVDEADTEAVAPCPGLRVGCGAVALLVGRAVTLGSAEAVLIRVGAEVAETPGEAEAEALAAALLELEGLGVSLSCPLPLMAPVVVGEPVELVQALGEAERVSASAPGDGVGIDVGGAEGDEGALGDKAAVRVPAFVALGSCVPLPAAVRDGVAVAAGLPLPLAVAAAAVAVVATVTVAQAEGEVEATAEEG